MFIVKHRIIFYIFSILLIGTSVFSLWKYGLNQGIDFKGGSLLEIAYTNEFTTTLVTSDQIKDILVKGGYADASVRSAGENDFIIRLKEITPEEKDTIVAALNNPEVKDFNVIGPVLGAEAFKKSALAVILVLVAIVFFITFAFRKVSKPISSWVYGLVAIVALVHDVLIPLGAFSILGHLYGGFELDTLFVTALLVILGFSVHDTIVVFDRVRENLANESGRKPFEEIVGQSVSQTFVRSINTSMTTILAILALYLLGPESTHHFSLVLLIGIITGTYSSIFIGSPLLVTINSWKSKK